MRQREEPLAPEDIVLTIFYGQPRDSLFGDGDGWEGVDLDASHARFCEALAKRIKARWPEVDVEVCGETDRRDASGFGADHKILDRVYRMADVLYVDAAKRAAELGYDGEVFDGEQRRGWVHADGGWTSC
jgi:hypothetical protein